MERWFFQRRAEIAIRLWRMPGKEEINHLAHRDLIGLRGKVKASLGAASRGDESAPDEQLQDFRRFSFWDANPFSNLLRLHPIPRLRETAERLERRLQTFWKARPA